MFFCHRLGQTKVNCIFRMINYEFNRNREKRKEDFERNNKSKKEKRGKEIRIMKLKAEQIEYELKKGEKRKGLTIGKYTGRGIPSPIREKL